MTPETVRQIFAQCPGWSGNVHVEFFSRIARDPNVKSACIAGVYCGRDMALLWHAGLEAGTRISITGVDLFSDAPCADWRPEDIGKTWQQAHGVDAPTLATAQANLVLLNVPHHLHQGDAVEYLKGTDKKWDVIFIDVSHDLKTTQDMITQAFIHLNYGGIIAGDDYQWDGVRAAVDAMIPERKVEDRIWWWKMPTKESA